jgi:peptidyl-tRNA hydrolase, PTH1 family
VEELARRHGARFRTLKRADVAEADGVTLIRPRTYMNLSGEAVQAALARGRVRPEALLVVHDDLDLPLGRLRFKRGGGAGGQRGVADIVARIGADFERLKLGISRPPAGWATEGWVLSRFRDDERDLVERVTVAAADAVERRLRDGWEAACSFANGLDLAAPAPEVEPSVPPRADETT